jgi:hypothetical protein
MPAHHSQARKLKWASIQHKTRFCRFFLSEEGCKNGTSCAFAHSAEEIQSSPLAKDIASNCSTSDDSTSVCSEETSLASVSSAETTSSYEASPQSSRQCWADVKDEDGIDEWQSMLAPCPQPVMREFSIAPVHTHAPPQVTTKATSKAERRELGAAAAKAKRAALTEAVLEGLLRQAQGPYVYED